MGKEPGDLIKIGEAARILGKATETLRRWDREGQGPKVLRVSGQRRYSRAEVEEMAAYFRRFKGRP